MAEKKDEKKENGRIKKLENQVGALSRIVEKLRIQLGIKDGRGKIAALAALLAVGIFVTFAFATSYWMNKGDGNYWDADGNIVNTGTVGGVAYANLKVKTAVINIGSLSGVDQKYLFVAPYACTISSIGLVSDTTVATNAAYWAFQVENLTQSVALGAAKNSKTEAITGDALWSFTTTSNLTLTADDVLELSVTTNGNPTALSSAEIMGVVEYY